jgi:formyl-CoA transferase
LASLYLLVGTATLQVLLATSSEKRAALERLETLLALVDSAEVLVENFRPGTLEKMGLGPDVLHARNPKLVLVRVTGWGQDGPYRHKPGFGTLAEGMSGFAALNGFDDREPVLPPMQLADCTAGLYGAFATMVALREVEVGGGVGQSIDLSLFEPLFSLMGPQAASYRASGRLRRRTGSRSTTAAPRNAYPTGDGRWVCLSASTQAMAERVLRAIGRPELVDDPRFRTNADRLRHAEELDALEDTLELLSDPKVMAEIEHARLEVRAGRSVSADELRAKYLGE